MSTCPAISHTGHPCLVGGPHAFHVSSTDEVWENLEFAPTMQDPRDRRSMPGSLELARLANRASDPPSASPARASDPRTSHEAAQPYRSRDVTKFRRGSASHLLLLYARSWPDADTALALARMASGFDDHRRDVETFRKRANELVAAGYLETHDPVMENGHRRTTYSLTDAGRRALDRVNVMGWTK